MKRIKKWISKGLQWHLIGIAVFVFMEMRTFKGAGMSASWVGITVLYIFNISSFYLSAYLIIPMIKLKVPFRLVRLLCYLAYVSFYACILFIPVFFLYRFNHGVFRGPLTKDEYSLLFYRSALFFIFAKILAMFLEKFREKDRLLEHERLLAEARQKNLEMENLMLRSQINPHFLNNGLSYIQTESLKISSDLAQWVSSFADVMKYHLSTGNNGLVVLDDDLDHLQNYVQSMRDLSRGEISISFQRQVDENSGEALIYPLLFMPFVENMFRHGNLKTGSRGAVIQVSREAGDLVLHTENEIAPGPAKCGSGIGLSNTKRRLLLLYPNRHELTVGVYDNRFIVKLKIGLWNN